MSVRRPAPLRPLERHRPPGPDPLRMALRDPLGVSPEATGRPLLLEAAAWEMARRFDGRRTADEIATEAAAALGRAVEPAQVVELERRLSGALLLADGAAEQAIERAFDGFRRAPRRAALGPGRDYETDPFDLRVRIGGLVADDWDMPALVSAVGLMTPAADLRSAAGLHSRSWAAVRHLRGHLARVVLLANAGAPFDEPLVPLAKPFDLPLGAVECDSAAVAALDVLPGRLQLAHGQTMALERALLFVRLLFPNVPALALLASSLDAREGMVSLDRAAAALTRVAELPGRTLFVAVADLWRAGGGEPATAISAGAAAAAPARIGGSLGSELRAHDDRALELCTELDHTGFRDLCLASDDPARAAHGAATYHVLRLLQGRVALDPLATGRELVQGSLLGYQQLATRGELASAASVVFH
ncbi:MAG: hypothetical protein GC161_02395 [Planctomycetaceae bacterium]|nr:hypothetical protein [Planctomycetaceae bacterium]